MPTRGFAVRVVRTGGRGGSANSVKSLAISVREAALPLYVLAHPIRRRREPVRPTNIKSGRNGMCSGGLSGKPASWTGLYQLPEADV